MNTLNLDDLRTNITGISETWISCYIEAAKVALIKNGHKSGIPIKVIGDFEDVFLVEWLDDLSQETIDSWKNDHDIAEFGAIAIALLLIQRFTDFDALEISNIGTGIDFWLGRKLPSTYAIQKREARLEISGIFSETSSNSISKRTWQKLKQLKKSDHTKLLGYVIITAFDSPKSKFVKK